MLSAVISVLNLLLMIFFSVCLSVFSILNMAFIIKKNSFKKLLFLSKGYGTTLQLGTLSLRNSAATSALGLPTSLGLREKLYLNYHS